MDWIFLITLLVLGLMAAADRLAEIIPKSRELTNFLKQSEIWIGVISVGLSICQLASLKYAKIFTLVQLASAVLMFLLGVLFSQNLLRTWARNYEQVNRFINAVVDKTVPLKEILGFAAIVISLIEIGYIIR